jgi:serine/threonine protein kinase
MAPEQAGRASGVGPEADVYALGAILYECLTGRPPFRGETAVETLVLAQTQRPEPPGRLRTGVPAALDEICLRCVEVDKQKRYASAEALAEDLERFLAGDFPKRRPEPRRRQRWILTALHVLTVLAIVVGLFCVNYFRILNVPYWVPRPPLIRNSYLPMLFLLIYSLCWLVYCLRLLLRGVDKRRPTLIYAFRPILIYALWWLLGVLTAQYLFSKS